MKKKNENKYLRIIKYRKVTDDCHYTGEYRDYAHSTFNLNHSVLKKNFYRCSYVHNYGYHFIIKELAKEFEKQFSCLGKDTALKLHSLLYYVIDVWIYDYFISWKLI